MIDFLLRVVLETWSILEEASIFLLFGFVLAGVLAVLVPARTVIRFFGRGRVKSVLWSSTIGVPLPLCSCGVLPTALGLRRRGATKGATVSFIISTPETGVDSISLTYALMDPIVMIFRPLAAMTTALTAGIATNFFGYAKAERTAATEIPAAEDNAQACHGHCHEHDFFEHHMESESLFAEPRRPPLQMVRHIAERIHHYAFRELFDEISYLLIAGIAASGVVAAALPASFFQQYLSGEFTSMIAMLLIGIPIYTCASASTPIAAAFVLKGLNPGAALVFLLAGPATSFVSVTVLLKTLGARVVAIYLGTIVVLTLLAGYALNRVYAALDIDPLATFGTAAGFVPEWLKIAGAVLLLVMMAFSMRRAQVPEEWLRLRDVFARLVRLARL
jgi:uncharacterized membrane protein YraQ (UPF0718 family)